jgi:hypothetical protein
VRANTGERSGAAAQERNREREEEKGAEKKSRCCASKKREVTQASLIRFYPTWFTGFSRIQSNQNKATKQPWSVFLGVLVWTEKRHGDPLENRLAKRGLRGQGDIHLSSRLRVDFPKQRRKKQVHLMTIGWRGLQPIFGPDWVTSA